MSEGSNSPGYADVNALGAARNIEGALWMLVSAFGFTVFIVLAKLISEDVHPVFLAFMRAFIALLVTLPFLLNGRVRLSTQKFELLFSRSMFGSMGFVFSMLAVWHVYDLPLAEFNALSFTRSLFVTIFAALFLRELVGPLRWGAVFIGFIGVLIMAVPNYVFFWIPSDSGPTLNLGSLFALLSAIFMAAAIVLVKSLTQYHRPLGLLTWANILTSALLFIPAVIYWSWPSAETWGMIFIMAITGLGAQFCYIKGMSVGDASFLSPMDYLRLPMAVAADWWLIKTFPGIYTWIGAGIIIAATLFITFRERMKAKRQAKRLAEK